MDVRPVSFPRWYLQSRVPRSRMWWSWRQCRYVRMTSVLSEANIVLRWWEDGLFSRFFSVVGITFSPSSHAYHVQPPQHQYQTKRCVRTFIRTVLQWRMYPSFLGCFWPNIHRETRTDPSLGKGRPQVRVVRFLSSIFVMVSPSFLSILSLNSLGTRWIR